MLKPKKKKNQNFKRNFTDKELYSNLKKTLTREQEYELANRWLKNKDTKARDRLIRAYHRLVSRHANKMKRANIEFDDLEQCAKIGLLEALDNFDPEKGYGFGTYSVFFVKAKIQEYILEFSSPVRIFNTTATKTLMSKYTKKIREMEAKEGRIIDDTDREKICEELGVKLEELRRYESVTAYSFSIDCGNGYSEHSDGKNVQIASNKDGLDISDTLATDQIIKQLKLIIFKKLKDREKRIILGRYFSDPTLTLDALAKEFNISRERVRQIETKALSDLKDEMISRGFLKFNEIFRI